MAYVEGNFGATDKYGYKKPLETLLYCFSPYYLEITGDETNQKITLTINSQSLVRYTGTDYKCKFPLSTLLQSFFYNIDYGDVLAAETGTYVNLGSKVVQSDKMIEVLVGTDTAHKLTLTYDIVFGALQTGEVFEDEATIYALNDGTNYLPLTITDLTGDTKGRDIWLSDKFDVDGVVSNFEVEKTTGGAIIQYGNLYNFHAASHTDIAPTGWHVMTLTEFNLIAADYTIQQLVEAGNTYWNNNLLGNNESNFSMRGNGVGYYASAYFFKFAGELVFNSMFNETYYQYVEFILSNPSPMASVSNDLGNSFFGIRLVRDTNVGWVEGDKITDYDLNEYDTISISGMVVSKQNFACTKLNDGTPIHLVELTDTNLLVPAISYPNNDILNVKKASDVEIVKTYTVKELPYCAGGHYLRWLDPEGEYKYFYFAPGIIKDELKDGVNIQQNVWGTDDLKSDIVLKDKTGNETYECGVLSANYQQQLHLIGLQRSIKQWIWENDVWVECRVQMPPIAINRFRSPVEVNLTIIKPSLYMQSL